MAGEFKQGSIKEKIYKKFLDSTFKTIRDCKEADQYGNFDSFGNFTINAAGEALLKKLRQDCWNITDAIGEAFQFKESDKILSDDLIMFRHPGCENQGISLLNLVTAIAKILVDNKGFDIFENHKKNNNQSSQNIDGHSISFNGSYLSLDGEEIRVHHADSADRLNPNSPDWNTINRQINKGKEKILDEFNKTASKQFLSKKVDDVAQGLIKFAKGLKSYQLAEFIKGIRSYGNSIFSGNVTSDNFIKGIASGQGWGFYYDEDGNSVLEVRKLLVGMKAIFAMLEIRKLSFTAGNYTVSCAGSKIVKVNAINEFGKKVEHTNQDIYAYRCYELADDGTTRTQNEWRIGDQAICQTFNIKTGVYKNAHNKYYWRLVIGTGEEEINGKVYNYIDLANKLAVTITDEENKTHTCIGYNNTSDIPEEGDEIAQLGSQITSDRQGAIQFVATGDNAPSINIYHKINDYNLDSHLVIRLSPNGSVVKSDNWTITNDLGKTEHMTLNRGKWESGEYCHYDIVTHNGRTWLCIIPSGEKTTQEPTDEATDWIVFVEKGENAYNIQIITNSNTIKNHQGKAELQALVYDGKEEITNKIPENAFSWERTSKNSEDDKTWNSKHIGYGSKITITADDVFGSAVFSCILNY